MTPVNFPEANTEFGPPPDMTEEQCQTIHACMGHIIGGSNDGAPMVVTAWKPDETDIERIKRGGLIYFSCIGGLPPHFLCTDFEEIKRQ